MIRQMLLGSAFALSAAPIAAEEGVFNFELENGLEVVVIEDARSPAVTHMLWYKVGSADEPAGVSGVAHFLEHLMFKATETLESGEFSRIVSANGGTDNAFTSLDYTGYFQRVAADRLGLMMQMEADRMENLRFDAAEIEAERSVVLEERNQRTDSEPGAVFSEQMRAAQFLNHRYGMPVVGWRQEIEAISVDDLQAFYDAHYAPNNAVLVVAGGVTADEVRALAEEHYGSIPADAGIAPRLRPQEPPQLSERRMVLRDERVSQPYVRRSYLVPERDPGEQKTAAALTYLATILGGAGATSVLGEALEFEQGKAVYTTASYFGLAIDDTTFSLAAVPVPDVSLREIEDAMDAVIAEFIETGVDPAKFERVKTQLRASEIYGQDSAHSRARRYGAALSMGFSVEDVQAWPDILAAVTPDDVVEAAKLIFDRDRAVTGWLMPQESEAEVTQ